MKLKVGRIVERLLKQSRYDMKTAWTKQGQWAGSGWQIQETEEGRMGSTGQGDPNVSDLDTSEYYSAMWGTQEEDHMKRVNKFFNTENSRPWWQCATSQGCMTLEAEHIDVDAITISVDMENSNESAEGLCKQRREECYGPNSRESNISVVVEKEKPGNTARKKNNQRGGGWSKKERGHHKQKEPRISRSTVSNTVKST